MTNEEPSNTEIFVFSVLFVLFIIWLSSFLIVTLAHKYIGYNTGVFYTETPYKDFIDYLIR